MLHGLVGFLMPSSSEPNPDLIDDPPSLFPYLSASNPKAVLAFDLVSLESVKAVKVQ
jgi:hypothetical protein